MKQLKVLRKRKKWTQMDVAQKIGVDRSTYTKYETGQSEPNFDILSKLSDLFDVSIDFLLGDGTSTPSSPNGVMVPVLGEVAGGLPLLAVENIIDYEELPKDMAASGDILGLRVKGHSMEPRICDGDVVIVRRQSDVECGDIAVVLVNGDSATVKKIKKEPDGSIWLIPNNPAFEARHYSPQEQETIPVKFFGKVIELRGKF